MFAVLLLLLPVLVLAAPAPTRIPSNLTARDIPTTNTTSPIAALEDAFRQLRTSKVSTAEVSTTEVEAAIVTTRSELKSGQCDDIIVIFARGTTEPGNVGDDVGPFFFDALVAAEPGRVIVQGVDNYPADIWGYLGGGSDTGAADMANSVKLAATQCPNSKVVLSGFSQGAQVTHKAAKLIPTNLYGLVGAIVLFGDPNNGDAFPGTLNNNVKTFCHDGDLICEGLPIPTDAHSTYEDDAPEAAAFVSALL